MPQLDLMHFFSQFFWFSLVFITLFFYMNFNILPLLVTTLKYRSKKLISLSTNIGNSKKNAIELHSFYDNIMFSAFKIINKKLLNSKIDAQTKIENNMKTLSKKTLYESNKNYFVSLQLNNYKDFVFSKKIKNEL